MSTPIIDLHCDLLAYLAEAPDRSPYDLKARCALPQLAQGGVAVQTLALFTETRPGSTEIFNNQLRAAKDHLNEIPRLNSSSWETLSTLHICFAIENASGLCEEDEPLQKAFLRLEALQHEIGPILYTSLTWNEENRFGGGNKTKVGLKREGELLLDHLHQLEIAIDLSHTSDQLADDILNYVYKKGLKIPVMASHSNLRAVWNVPRNLPTDVALEIHRLGGVIGLNLFKPFLGGEVDALLDHINFAEQLGIDAALVFGADFFSDLDIDSLKAYPRPLFFPEAQDASCYPHLIKKIPPRLHAIGHKNAARFIRSCLQNSID